MSQTLHRRQLNSQVAIEDPRHPYSTQNCEHRDDTEQKTEGMPLALTVPVGQRIAGFVRHVARSILHSLCALSKRGRGRLSGPLSYYRTCSRKNSPTMRLNSSARSK